MLKIVSLNFGTGGGHLFCGLALWQAFKRSLREDFTFYLMTSSSLPVPLEDETLEILRFNLEPQKAFLNPKDTMLYQYLQHLDADVILVDHIWFPVFFMLDDFKAVKVIYFRHVKPPWLKTPLLPDGTVREFVPDQYNFSFTMEPNFHVSGTESLPPIIGVSKGDVKAPEIIRRVLNVPKDKKLMLVAHNGLPGEIEKFTEDAAYNPEEYVLYSLGNINEAADRLFPLSHYLSGVDMAIGACGYNFFYETRFYDLPTVYIPIERAFESPLWRYETNRTYTGPFNGADICISKILDSL